MDLEELASELTAQGWPPAEIAALTTCLTVAKDPWVVTQIAPRVVVFTTTANGPAWRPNTSSTTWHRHDRPRESCIATSRDVAPAPETPPCVRRCTCEGDCDDCVEWPGTILLFTMEWSRVGMRRTMRKVASERAEPAAAESVVPRRAPSAAERKESLRRLQEPLWR